MELVSFMFRSSAGLAYLIGTSIAWSRWLLHAFWSLWGGEIGPWSDWKSYAVAFLILFSVQAIPVAVFGIVGRMILFSEYSAGWD